MSTATTLRPMAATGTVYAPMLLPMSETIETLESDMMTDHLTQEHSSRVESHGLQHLADLLHLPASGCDAARYKLVLRGVLHAEGGRH